MLFEFYTIPRRCLEREFIVILLSRLLTINYLILLRHLLLLDNRTNHFRLHNRDRDSLVSVILSLVVEIRERDLSRRNKGRRSREAAALLSPLLYQDGL